MYQQYITCSGTVSIIVANSRANFKKIHTCIHTYIHTYIHTVSGFSACQCSCLSLVLGLGPSFGSRTIRRVVSKCGMEVKQLYSVICEHEYVVLIVYTQSGEESVY